MSVWQLIDLEHPAPAGVPVLLAYGFKADKLAVATWERVGTATGWHLGGNTFAAKPRYWLPIPTVPNPGENAK